MLPKSGDLTSFIQPGIVEMRSLKKMFYNNNNVFLRINVTVFMNDV